ncbi:hypothetical protein ACSNOK_10100 [Streptomyces sp. URMC 126]
MPHRSHLAHITDTHSDPIQQRSAIHIGAALLGHLGVQITRGYVASSTRR